MTSRVDLGLGRKAPYVNATIAGGMFGVLLTIIGLVSFFMNSVITRNSEQIDMLIKVGIDQADKGRIAFEENNKHQWDAIATNQKELINVGKMVEKHDINTMEVVKQLQVLIDETKRARIKQRRPRMALQHHADLAEILKGMSQAERAACLIAYAKLRQLPPAEIKRIERCYRRPKDGSIPPVDEQDGQAR